jgi:hypothetical protein
VRKNQTKKAPTTNSKWVSLALLIVVLGFVYYIPLAILQHRYASWIALPLIFFVISALIIMTFNLFKLARYGILLGLVSVLIVGPTSGLFIDYRTRQELKKNGIWTKSVVIDRDYSKHNWRIKCRYKANDKWYETYYYNDEDSRMVGDTLNVIYSKKFPGIHYVDYEWKK